MMTILGWGVEQFALAKNYHKSITGAEATCDMDGAFQVFKTWKDRRIEEPCEVKLEGVKHDLDWSWAVEMFPKAYKI